MGDRVALLPVADAGGGDYVLLEKGEPAPAGGPWDMVREFRCYRHDYQLWKKRPGAGREGADL